MVASTRSVDGVTLTIFRCGGTLACCLTWLSLIGRRRLSMGSYSRRRCFLRSCVYWLCEVYARGTLGLLHRSGGAGRASGRRSMARYHRLPLCYAVNVQYHIATRPLRLDASKQSVG